MKYYEMVGQDKMIKAKKSLGQNFLKDKNVLEKISNSFSVQENDLIIEIGPGMGALTEYLTKKSALVIAYEIDRRMKEYLDKINNLQVIYEDFLKCDFKDLPKYENLYIIANIPYYITTPIIEHIINKNIIPKEMVLLVQEEVANRFSALPKSKENGYFTIYLNHYFQIEKLFKVPAEAFVPAPKVNSAVIKFTKKEKVDINDKEFLNFVKESFGLKRKTLKNNLQEKWDMVKDVIYAYGFNDNVRAEELSYELFVEMFKKLEEIKDIK